MGKQNKIDSNVVKFVSVPIPISLYFVNTAGQYVCMIYP